MRVYLDKSKQDIMDKMRTDIGEITLPDGTWHQDFDSAWLTIYNDFMINMYPVPGKRMDILRNAAHLYNVMNNKQPILDAMQILLDSLQPESELDEILLTDEDI